MLHKEKTKVATAISLDTTYNLTPDTPRLRYKGPQRVFLWDNTKEYQFLSSKLSLVSSEDFLTESYVASTKDKFLPFRNEAGATNGHNAFYHLSPPNTDWRPKLVPSSIDSFIDLNLQRVSGRVISFSLNGIQSLDRYYANTMNAYRIKRRVYLSAGKSDDSLVNAWLYVVNFKAHIKYNPHANEYRFGSSSIMRPVRTQPVFGEPLYRVA